ncbi:hypothetical protein AYO22_09508 [Fonsecaea multimorphosa]|nr:hypothetical protein AYO22_09508 [Fonsecaea multimorphosa]
MPSILSDADKETVKRTVPKASNKIQAVAVARLYVSLPNSNRWTYTGLQGAAVLSNDLVGNTFWIKLVDISPANRGVIWDQEIYDTFQYNQDRTFFHSFELEQCLAGLSFVDEKEARQFKKKMDEREKNASKHTKAQPFASAAGGGQIHVPGGSHKHHSRVSNLFRGHRHSSASQQPPLAPQPIYSTGLAPASYPRGNADTIDLADPSLRPILDELVQMGITEDQIAQNVDFIKRYVQEKQAEGTGYGTGSAIPTVTATETRSRAPPPPPPPSAPPSRISPENTGSSSRRGPPPAPPPSRRPVGGRAPSPPRSSPPPPARTPSPPPSASPQPRFRAPPPIADAGKFAVKEGPALHPSGRARASSGSLANPGPPPPPRPPKTPIEEEQPQGGLFRVPPPFTGERKSSAPPPPPSRGPVPPPPPSRETPTPYAGPPPPLPPKAGQTPSHSALFIPQPPPPPPARNNAPPLPPPNTRAVPPPPTGAVPPPPPPCFPRRAREGAAPALCSSP